MRRCPVDAPQHPVDEHQGRTEYPPCDVDAAQHRIDVCQDRMEYHQYTSGGAQCPVDVHQGVSEEAFEGVEAGICAVDSTQRPADGHQCAMEGLLERIE